MSLILSPIFGNHPCNNRFEPTPSSRSVQIQTPRKPVCKPKRRLRGSNRKLALSVYELDVEARRTSPEEDSSSDSSSSDDDYVEWEEEDDPCWVHDENLRTPGRGGILSVSHSNNRVLTRPFGAQWDRGCVSAPVSCTELPNPVSAEEMRRLQRLARQRQRAERQAKATERKMPNQTEHPAAKHNVQAHLAATPRPKKYLIRDLHRKSVSEDEVRAFFASSSFSGTTMTDPMLQPIVFPDERKEWRKSVSTPGSPREPPSQAAPAPARFLRRMRLLVGGKFATRKRTNTA